MNNSRIFLIIFCLCGIPAASFSQENDACLWMSANLEKRITQNLALSFSQEVRMNENITEVGTVFSDIGASWRFSKRFKGELHYRFTHQRRLDDSYDRRHRYYVDLNYKEKFKPLVLALRMRYQSEYTDICSFPEGTVPENYLRERITLQADLSRKYEPYLYTEFFEQLNSKAGILFDKIRYCAGVEYSFTKRHKIDLFYIIQQEVNKKNPRTDFIIGIGYYFVL